MKLRDKIAMQAMEAIIAKMPFMTKYYEDDVEFEAIYAAVARGAYYYADAMMIARGDE